MDLFQCGVPRTELNPNNVQGSVKHGGGGVMVWDCMSSTGVGY